jgi:hypothetical protein
LTFPSGANFLGQISAPVTFTQKSGFAQSIGATRIPLIAESRTIHTTSAPQAVTVTDCASTPTVIVKYLFTARYVFSQTNTCPVSPTALPSKVSCTVNLTFTLNRMRRSPASFKWCPSCEGNSFA